MVMYIMTDGGVYNIAFMCIVSVDFVTWRKRVIERVWWESKVGEGMDRGMGKQLDRAMV